MICTHPNVCASMSNKTSRQRKNRSAFTLVEMLVVVFIFLILTAIALPSIRGLLRDSKNAQQARQLVAFLQEARSRAIASNSEVGVLFPRLGTDSDFRRSLSIRMQLSNSVPPYAGETPSASAVLFFDPSLPSADNQATTIGNVNASGGTNSAYISADDAPLLYLSAQRLASNPNAATPIGPSDRLEFQGGRSVVIRSIHAATHNLAGTLGFGPGTQVVFDPRETLTQGSSFNTQNFPESFQFRTAPSRVKFRIHRSPNVSTVGSKSLLKGLAIDFNYSGIGPNGFQFAPHFIAPNSVGSTSDADMGPVSIVFSPDGTVAYMNHGVNLGSAGFASTSVQRPASNIYLMVGKIDGVRPDSLFDTTSRPVANIMSRESIWIVINPFTGLIEAAPAASVSATSSGQAVLQSRQFALQSDKLSTF